VDIRPIRTVLAANGIQPEDIRMIANCHFHSDHSGGNFEFPGVPIFVQRAELARLRATPDYTHAPSVADFPGAALEEIDGEAAPLPGVRIVPTPGHSPGHQSLVVETKEGRVILGGQAFNCSSDYAQER
jgi:N-acyl homoserine lactone hydrolase